MKRFLFICFSLCSLCSFSQDKNSFYALDAKMNATTLDSSKYILWIHEKEDGNWQWDYYNTWGPLIKSQSFADHDGTILNGRSLLFNKTGNLDSLGIFDHGKRNGTFYKYKTIRPDSVITLMQYDYAEDSLLKKIDLLNDTLKNKDEDTTGTESEYPGGIRSWNYYLQHSLTYPDRAVNKEIQGQVKIFFMVDTSGVVSDVYLARSLEYSLDQESLRVIKNSGKWNPAIQHGEPKKSYKLMPINFKLESQ
jgi:periplasmic protein TonB